MTWNRSKDALIARVAEGRLVVNLNPTEEWIMKTGGLYDPIPHYLTDLPACIRAAEAWRKQDKDNRFYSVHVDNRYAEAFFFERTDFPIRGLDWGAKDQDECAARATALWKACGGVDNAP